LYVYCMFTCIQPLCMPYRRDLLMLGHPDGWRLPCSDT
jgi:hypothetical protein